MELLRKFLRRASPGTAMAETAVTISFALLCLYGGMEIALIGYDQLQLDGGTFFLTHAYAGQLAAGAGNISSLDTTLAPLFPNVTLTAATFTFQTPPNTTVMPNFTQWGTVSNRFGGVSILRPQRLQASISQSIASSKTNAVWNPFGTAGATVTSGNVDARPAISNHDFDTSGEDYNTTTTYTDALAQDDQNVPPYYIAQAFMWYCTPWVKYNNGNGNTRANGQTTCTSKLLAGLGLAEYLKSDNYNNTANGIDTNGVFTLVKCHQQRFADVAAQLVALGAPGHINQGQWDKSTIDNDIAIMDAQSNVTGSSWDVAPVPTHALAIPLPVDQNPAQGC